jgi:hypothetical protein
MVAHPNQGDSPSVPTDQSDEGIFVETVDSETGSAASASNSRAGNESDDDRSEGLPDAEAQQLDAEDSVDTAPLTTMNRTGEFVPGLEVFSDCHVCQNARRSNPSVRLPRSFMPPTHSPG